MEPSPWMGPSENMSGIQKLQFSLTKKQKNKIKTNPLACFLGGPIQGLGSICFFILYFVYFCFSIWAYFGFVFLFFTFSSNRGRCGRVTVVKVTRKQHEANVVFEQTKGSLFGFTIFSCSSIVVTHHEVIAKTKRQDWPFLFEAVC